MNLPHETEPPDPLELSAADERALDALLAEAMRDVPPRDFTNTVMARLRTAEESSTRTVQVQRDDQSPRRFAAVPIKTLVAVLAASLAGLIIYWNSPSSMLVTRPSHHGGNAPAGTGRSSQGGGQHSADSPQKGSQDPSAQVADGSGERPPRLKLSDGIDLGAAESETPLADAESAPPRSPPSGLPSTGPTAPLADSLHRLQQDLPRFDDQFVAYWSSLGVTPAGRIEPASWSDRVADRFGITVPAEADLDRWGQRVATGEAAEELARRLVSRMFRDLRLDAQTRQQLAGQLAQVIHSGRRFDVWLANWLQGRIERDRQGEQTDSPSGNQELLTQWLGHSLLSVDVGCARCHDSPLNSEELQQDYWSTVAMLASGSERETFFELPDGRQRVATARLPARWFGLPAERFNDVDQAEPTVLAQLLLDNHRVARTLANHLWAIGLGTPLVAPASSPIAPPRDQALDEALDLLSERLIQSGFDIRAGVLWVIASDPMWRDVPQVFAGNNWLVAPEDDLAQASLAQRSFAAARPHWPRTDQSRLLAMMKSRAGAAPQRLSPREDAVLAQPLVVAPRRASGSDRRRADSAGLAERGEDYWWAQWMADREGLRGGWMESIRDPREKLRHAFYAAGHRRVSQTQWQLAESLWDALPEQARRGDDVVAMLHWVIQNTR